MNYSFPIIMLTVIAAVMLAAGFYPKAKATGNDCKKIHMDGIEFDKCEVPDNNNETCIIYTNASFSCFLNR